MDEEGDMVTEKTYVYESCSSDEDFKVKKIKKLDTNKDKNTSVSSKPIAKNPPKKTKQQSIMGFFNKK